MTPRPCYVVERSAMSERRRRFDVILSALVVLVVCVPTMAVEEDWHGHPMIDQSSHLWIVFACIAAASFVGGGAFAGIRRPERAAVNATASSVLALVVLVAADLCRRLLVVHDGMPVAVVRLWLIGVLTALALSATGSLLGRRLAG